jgi:signal peptidase I
MRDVRSQVAQELAGVGLEKGDLLRLKVISDSMSPLLKPGDFVIVKWCSPESLRRGDLVVTKRDSEWITHRLVKVDEHGWHTKGDRCRLADPAVGGQEIQGVVTARERRGKLHGLQASHWGVINRMLGRLGWWEAFGNSPLVTLPARVLRRVLLWLY